MIRTIRAVVMSSLLLAVAVLSGVPAEASHSDSGYWMLTADGQVFAFGGSVHYGDTVVPNTRVDIEPTPTGHGYWVLSKFGSVYAFGDAAYFAGGDRLAPDEEFVSMSATAKGDGMWLFTNRGRVMARGAAAHYGDMSGTRLNGPVLDSVATPSGRGYWMVASDGGVFTFGDAEFVGSMGGIPLNKPVMSLAPDPDKRGYWLVASDGGIFSFDATFYGSMGGTRLNKPISGLVGQPGGYLMVAEDGGIFAFGEVEFHGSLGSNPPPSPVVAVAPIGNPPPPPEYAFEHVMSDSGTTDKDTAPFSLTTQVARLNYTCNGDNAGCIFTIREFQSGRQVDFVSADANTSGQKVFHPDNAVQHYVEVSEFNSTTQWSLSIEQQRCVKHCPA